MSWRDTYGGNYLKAVDLPAKGKRVKLAAINEEVLRHGERPKLVAEIPKLDKRWVLNATNCELLEQITGSDEPDDWDGRTVELFNDATVRGPNGEKGGIRCRPPQSKAKVQQSDFEEDDSDLDEDD